MLVSSQTSNFLKISIYVQNKSGALYSRVLNRFRLLFFAPSTSPKYTFFYLRFHSSRFVHELVLKSRIDPFRPESVCNGVILWKNVSTRRSVERKKTIKIYHNRQFLRRAKWTDCSDTGKNIGNRIRQQSIRRQRASDTKFSPVATFLRSVSHTRARPQNRRRPCRTI